MSTPGGFGSASWPPRLIAALDAADRRTESLAKQLDRAQLNWQPRPDAWSIGQCLDHLRVGAEVYLGPIAAALEGREAAPVDEIHLGWFSRRFIRAYIAPNPGGTRAKAPAKARPAPQVETSVVEGFLQTNQAARGLIKLAGNYDVNGIRFRNPFIPLLRFTVGTGLEIIVQHQGRHLLQAENVTKSPGFPN